MGAHFETLIEGVLMALLDFRYTQVGFNLISVLVCKLTNFMVLVSESESTTLMQGFSIGIESEHSGIVILVHLPSIKRFNFLHILPRLIEVQLRGKFRILVNCASN